MHDLYLTCPLGLEEITKTDIAKYVKSDILIENGGIKFSGDLESLYRVNLYSRTGMYLLLKIDESYVTTYDNIYDFFAGIRWDKIIKPSQTFAIRGRIKSNRFSNTNLCTLKSKDAIVDIIKDRCGTRPSIDKQSPDISIFLFIKDNKISVYLNSSGLPLFKRGYRSIIHKASLNESLAAGIILLSNWDRKNEFYDPMCGSGTFSIEAALIGKNIPPGWYRKKFGFENWTDFNKKIWLDVRDDARSSIIREGPPIFGSDILARNVTLSIKNANKINIYKDINFYQQDILDFKSSNSYGTIIVNPPYGYRLGDAHELKSLYRELGNVFKKKCIGHDVYVFTANNELSKLIGLRTKKRTILYNGKLDSRLLYYPIREGKYG